MRRIDYIILHCSDSEWGDVEIIDQWHKKRGWKEIGYHYVILNGYRTYNEYIHQFRENVGMIEKGRPDSEIGAHVKGMNTHSIGVCMIGVKNFPFMQLHTTFKLLAKLLLIYHLSIKHLLGHYETHSGKAQGKTCPNIDMTYVRMWVSIYMKFLISYNK